MSVLTCVRLVASLAVTSIAFARPQEPSSSARSLADAALSASISSVIASSSLKPYVPPLASDSITEWIALGDSFASGVGSNGLVDYIRGSDSCHRYKQAYSMQVQANTQWPGSAVDRKFTFGACSGAAMHNILEDQLTDTPPYDHVKMGNPQLAMLTVSGNDLNFANAINSCVFRAYGFPIPPCVDVLSDMEQQILDPAFQAAIDHNLLTIVAKGRMKKGATPVEAFQVFFNGYIPFWNEVDENCNHVSWALVRFWKQREASMLTTQIRKRMNDLVKDLNHQLQLSAARLKDQGVIYVDGFQDSYTGHQFCDPSADPNVQSPISPNTWFWHPDSPWNAGEGPTPSSDPSPSSLGDDILTALVPNSEHRASITAGGQAPTDFSDAFKSREALEVALNGLRNNADPNVAGLSDRLLRIFPPKGTGLSHNAMANVDAVLAARNPAPVSAAAPPTSTPPAPSSTSAPATAPEASDICGTWYKVVLDYFEVRGKDFEPARFRPDGSGLKKQIQGCGKLTKWHLEYTPDDPRFDWFAKGNLPIGVKGCIGRAVVSAGGKTADDCRGSG